MGLIDGLIRRRDGLGVLPEFVEADGKDAAVVWAVSHGNSSLEKRAFVRIQRGQEFKGVRTIFDSGFLSRYAEIRKRCPVAKVCPAWPGFPERSTTRVPE